MSSVFELSGLIEIATFEGAFDLLHAGVVFVDHDCKIIHANRAARAMLEKGSPIRSVHGDLKTPLPRSTTALKKAVAMVVEPAIGGMGIGVPMPQSDGDPAYIHVLPLVTGDTRSRPARCVTAAVFITVWDGRAGPPVEAVAAVFGLTAGEIHVAERLLTGRTPAEIAEDLALAMSTVRSHLKSIFAKTGTSRQSDLVRLATQLAAPIECVTRLNDRSSRCPLLEQRTTERLLVLAHGFDTDMIAGLAHRGFVASKHESMKADGKTFASGQRTTARGRSKSDATSTDAG